MSNHSIRYIEKIHGLFKKQPESVVFRAQSLNLPKKIALAIVLSVKGTNSWLQSTRVTVIAIGMNEIQGCIFFNDF